MRSHPIALPGALALLLPPDDQRLGRPPRRYVRAWLFAQAILYSLAAWGALTGAFAPKRVYGLDVGDQITFAWIRESVLIGGLILAGLGAIMIKQAVRHRPNLELPAAPARLQPVLHRMGHIGAATRAIMFLLPGMILIAEAWAYRRGTFGRVTRTVGLALQEPYGRVLLVVLSAGLAAFAVYELAAAVYRRQPTDHVQAAAAPTVGLVEVWRAVLMLLAGGVLLWGILVVVGRLAAASTPATGRGGEQAVDTWFADHRIPALNLLSGIATGLADTVTCITVAGVTSVILVIWLNRWREPVVLLLAITGELLVFVLVTATVHRTRPAVPHLDPAPPTSSFPSGHTGAAVALYGCILVILLRQLRHRRAATVAAVLLAAIPVLVGISRMYRGMHFPTDVLAGAAAGGAWLALVLLAVYLPLSRPSAPRQAAMPRARMGAAA